MEEKKHGLFVINFVEEIESGQPEKFMSCLEAFTTLYPPYFLLPLCLISPCFLSSKRQRSTVLDEKPVSAIISPVLQFECFSIKERTSLIFSSEGVMDLRLTFGRTVLPWIFLPLVTALYPRRPSMTFLAIFSCFFFLQLECGRFFLPRHFLHNYHIVFA